MANNVNNWCSVNCPVDCDDTLVVVPDFGCEAPNNDQITEIFYSNQSLETGLLTEWNTRLSNRSTANANTIRSLKMLGDLPHVEPAFKTSRLGASIPIETDKVINYTIEDDKDSVFEFYKQLQCGLTKKFWFRSGGHIYGGLSGIYGTLVGHYGIDSASDLMAHHWKVQLRFRSKCFPDRVVAVI